MDKKIAGSRRESPIDVPFSQVPGKARGCQNIEWHFFSSQRSEEERSIMEMEDEVPEKAQETNTLLPYSIFAFFQTSDAPGG
jgi:hypothetical protein